MGAINTFWATAFGAALGLVAGVLVQFIAQSIFGAMSDRRIKKAIAKECEFNLGALDEVDGALRAFRNAVNGDAPHTAMAYIPCHKGLHLQVNNLAGSGRLYEFFDGENLKRIQNVTTFLTGHTGNFFDQQLETRKQALMLSNGDKAECVAFLNFADTRSHDCRKDLEALRRVYK